MSFFGAHMSIQNGIPSALKLIKEMNANMIQIFISNPMSSQSSINKKKYDEKYIQLIKDTVNETNTKIVIHLPYVINLAKPLLHDIKSSWWIDMICNQLKISDLIGSIGCVVHVGKYLELTQVDGVDNMFNALKYVINFLKSNDMKSHIILETPAGQGSELLSTIENFAEFYNKFDEEDKKYIKICVDTCHIFVSGIDIRKREQVKQYFDKFNGLIGIQNIDLVHMNDSKSEFGSHLDRHENLGEGKIGIDGLRHIMRYCIYYHIPMILETHGEYEKELALINDVKNGVNNWIELKK